MKYADHFKLACVFKIFAVFFFLAFSLSTTAQRVGGNYNERIQDVDPALIQNSGTDWVRAFVNINKLVTTNNNVITGINQSAIDNVNVSNLKSASGINVGNGTVKVIFSLKFEFKHSIGRVPEASSSEFNYLEQAVEQVLLKENIGSHIEILVVGNEPMWETPNDNANVNRLKDFTNKMINKVTTWRNNMSAWTYDVFVGALNRFGELQNNNIRNTILQIAKNNNKVDGLDLHSHVKTEAEITSDLQVLRNTENFNKDVIVTEFSLHRMFLDHKNDILGQWGPQHGYPSGMKTWEWINDLLSRAESGNPISKNEFMSFFNSRNWYPQTWFQDFYNAFIDYDVRVATYGFERRIIPGFRLNSNSPMWVINALYNEALLGRDNQGFFQSNPINHPTFKEIVGPFDQNVGVYRVLSVRSGKALDVAGCSISNGANVQQWPWNGANCQRWKFEYLGGGEYKVTSERSGQALDVQACSEDNGANVQQWPWNGADCQRWYVQPLGGGDYRMVSKRSRKVLDVAGCSTNDGANVQQWQWNGANCQRWTIESTSNLREASEDVSRIRKEFEKMQFAVYPNPAQDQFSIDNPKMQNVDLNILNVNGQSIYYRENIGSHINIRTDLFKKGVYVVQVSNDDIVRQQKLIVE